MFAIAYPTSFFATKDGVSSELETPESSWKGSFGAIWKTHRTSILIGSGLAVAAAFAAVLNARQVTVPEPTHPFPPRPAPHFPVPQNIFGLGESRSDTPLSNQSFVPPFSSQIGIDQSENPALSLADLADAQLTKLNGASSLDPVVSSGDAKADRVPYISHNSHQAAKEDSVIGTGYPVSDFPKLNTPAPSLFSPNPKAMAWRAFSSGIPITLVSAPSTSANCLIDSLSQNEGRLDLVNQDNSTTSLLPLVLTVEKPSILTQAWESVAPMAYDRLNQFASYLKNDLSEGRDELSFNLFSLRVVYDISALGGALYYTHSRGLGLSPGDKSLLALGVVKTFRDIFMPPLQPSMASSVIKILGMAFAFSRLIN